MNDTIPQELLDVLACPEDKAGLKPMKTKNALECTKCGREYAIKDGIPVFVRENKN
jgi:uncharacterized protein YbaR (Trm112 family)